MAQVEIKVPDIGDFKEVEVIEVLVKPGDAVKVEQSLITVESDKASMEIPSSHAGTVGEMRVKLGDKVSQGSVVLVLDAQAAPASAAAPAPAAAALPATVVAPGPAPAAAGAVATFTGAADLECDVLVLEAAAGGASAPVPAPAPATAPTAPPVGTPVPAVPAGLIDVLVPDIGDFKDVND